MTDVALTQQERKIHPCAASHHLQHVRYYHRYKTEYSGASTAELRGQIVQGGDHRSPP